ncbi:MAG TPA: ROK family protein [Bdellovibrionota bacterium]|nr:ROK family protein [Bdellovibrionota bacterium]
MRRRSQGFIGVDFGGTFIKAGLVGKNLKIKSFSEASIPPKASQKQVSDIIIGLVDHIKEKNNLKKIKAVCVACAGPVNSSKGIIKVAPNFTHWQGKSFHLGKVLTLKFKTHVQLENDTTAASVAEFHSRKKSKITSLVSLTLGTGIGGGVVVDGKPLRGLNWLGGEIGHVPILSSSPSPQVLSPQGRGGIRRNANIQGGKYKRRKCVCGNKGCAETLGSATALVKRFKELAQNHSLNLTAQTIAEKAIEEEPLAQQVFNEVGTSLGLLIAIICNILDPDVVVIGGGMSRAHKLFMPALKKKFSEHAFMHPLRKKNPIEISKLNKTAGLLGAVLCTQKLGGFKK